MTHTPAPWHIDGDRGVIYSGDGETTDGDICQLLHDNDVDFDRCAEDARLIAAAPETAAERDRLKASNADLLAALEAVLGDCERWLIAGGRTRAPILEVVRTAIARAKGEQP